VRFMIQYDLATPPLVSDLHILATVRSSTVDFLSAYNAFSLYIDRDRVEFGVRRSEYIHRWVKKESSTSNDEISVVSNWPKLGGPHVAILPEGQRIFLGELPQGVVIEFATWRGDSVAHSLTNLVRVRVNKDVIADIE